MCGGRRGGRGGSRGGRSGGGCEQSPWLAVSGGGGGGWRALGRVLGVGEDVTSITWL